MSADHHISRKQQAINSKHRKTEKQSKVITVAPQACLYLTRDQLVLGFMASHLIRAYLGITNSMISELLLQIRKIIQMLLMEKLKRSQ